MNLELFWLFSPPPCQQRSAFIDPTPLMTSAFARPPPSPLEIKISSTFEGYLEKSPRINCEVE